jgi:hypothetical protein
MSQQYPLIVLYEGLGDIAPFSQLAEQLAAPLWQEVLTPETCAFFVTWRDAVLQLGDNAAPRAEG